MYACFFTPHADFLFDASVFCCTCLALSALFSLDFGYVAGLATLAKLAFVRMAGCPKLLAPPTSQPALLQWVAHVRAMAGSSTYEHGYFESDLTPEQQASIDTGCRCRHCEGVFPQRQPGLEAEYRTRKAAYVSLCPYSPANILPPPTHTHTRTRLYRTHVHFTVRRMYQIDPALAL